MGDMNEWISKVSNGNINESQIESLRWGGYMKSIEEFDNKFLEYHLEKQREWIHNKEYC